ncbi:MAG: hypothetical protein HY978_04825 [Candidatus Liptonbacteria bacterium]|nr:hypothetical protein [Candidatus Liptonbacteria bacterium]
MEPRTIDILEAAVREFIATGEPISSSLLFERYDFGIRPAMIRHELCELTDEGYLEQPYHSSGRVPADKGYEFYAERALGHRSVYADRLERELSAIFRAQSWPGLAAWISGALHGLGVVYEEGAVHKEGLERIFDRLELQDRAEIRQIIRDYESLDERFEKTVARIAEESARTRENESGEPGERVDDSIGVFIGRDSPLTRSGQLMAIAGDYRNGDERVVICLVGPKRLDYERAATIFQALQKVVNN